MHISESGDSFLSEDNQLMSRFDTAFAPLGHSRGTIISRYQLNQSSVYRL